MGRAVDGGDRSELHQRGTVNKYGGGGAITECSRHQVYQVALG